MKHNPNQSTVKRIPYGVADYRRLRTENCYYVDKTGFIPMIEAAPFYLFCIRPRRFGKSLWLSTLQYYYDVNYAEQFDLLFGDTYIGAHPTPERNSYLVMFLNFAAVNPTLKEVQQSFELNGREVTKDFLIRYGRFFTPETKNEILALPTVVDQLRAIFFAAHRHNLKIYLLIDEYDNFTNTILTTEGEQPYHELTHGAGFFRHFFNLLKSATAGQTAGLTRLFITGVSPVTMDDVTSGFNIGTNISLQAQYNEMIGFTEPEVRSLLTDYAQAGVLRLGVEESFSVMQTWYNNYRFSEEASLQLFNSDMVLYFLVQVQGRSKLPLELIDANVRIDYRKLRHLMAVDKHLNGNFSQLKTIIETGEAKSHVVTSFPIERLRDRENFISLLVYFGLLTFAGEREGEPRLQIPNRTVKDLMYSYIRDGLSDVDVFRLDLWQLSRFLQALAYRGEWRPLFEFLSSEIQKQTSIRDYLNGEKVIQGFLLAYLNVSHFFLIWPEYEIGGGFVDLYLEPFLARYSDMRYGYLIELKYIARNEYSNDKLQQKIDEAATQLKKYRRDERVERVAEQVAIKCLILVYNGWELVYCAEWDEQTNTQGKPRATHSRPKSGAGR